eukprot:gene21734-27787_t
MLRSLKILTFNFAVDDARLNATPTWLSQLVDAQMKNASVANKQPAPGNANGLGRKGSSDNLLQKSRSTPSSTFSMMDSFFQSFESGLEKVISKVEVASVQAAKFINETLDAENGPPGAPDTSPPQRPGLKRAQSVTSFFGSSLRELVLDEFRCTHAHLNPLLGIPTQALKMINFVNNYVQTPELFRQRANLNAVADLRRAIEEERGIPLNCDISVVAHVLVMWLNQLPEPLLGYEHYDALLACQNLSLQGGVDEEQHRVRNFSLLVSEAPWYCKPLLLKVMGMLHKCIEPEHTATNKLNSIAVSVLSTPFVLRPFVGNNNARRGSYVSNEETERVLLAAAAAGSTCVEYMIVRQQEIFHATRNDLSIKQNHLAQKCSRIRELQESLSQIVYVPQDIHSTSEVDGEQAKLIFELFTLLEPAEKMLCFTPTADSGKGVRSSESGSFLGLSGVDELGSIAPPNTHNKNKTTKQVPVVKLPNSNTRNSNTTNTNAKLVSDSNDELDDILFGSNSNDDLAQAANHSANSDAIDESSVRAIHALLRHPRWDVCGISSSDPASSSDKDSAANVLKDFNSNYGFVALQCLVGFLRRFEDKGAAIIRDFVEQRRNFCTLSKSSTLSLIQRLSMHPAWALMNEENCFQDFFDVALLSFDDAWKMSCDKVQQLPTSDTYSEALFACRRNLWDIISKRPKTSNAVWELWMQNRLREQERLCAATVQMASPVAAVVVNANAVRDEIESQFVAPPEERVVSPRIVVASVAVSGAKQGSHVVSGTVVQSSPAMVSEISLAVPSAANGLNSQPSSKKDHVVTPPPVPLIIGGASNKRNSVPKPSVASSSSIHSPNSILPTSYNAQYDQNEHNSECVLDGSLGLDKSAPPSHHSSLFTAEADWSHVDVSRDAMAVTLSKSCSGIVTSVFGGSSILSERHIHQLEAILPQSYQCYDWRLLYRLSIHGASLSTMLNRAQGVPNSLLVVRDSNGAVFGALISEYLKINEKEKYYGNGTIGVWSFASGALHFYPWSFKNSYFLLSSREAIAFGGGGNFAIYMDGDLNKGSSGPCATYSSPCLASSEQFVCNSCELYALESCKG